MTPPLSDPAAIALQLARQARAASLELAGAPAAAKDRFLGELARLIEQESAALLTANEQDLAAGRAAGLPAAMLDRLTLNPKRLAQMAEGVRQVQALPDPVGAELGRAVRPTGIEIRKVRVPIGVIGIVFESRPNVTVDCAILCLKSGNASILRGGKESLHSNLALAGLISRALATAALPAHAVQLVATTDRAVLGELLKLDAYIQCLIPRGGESLIRFVVANSSIPVIKHYKGVCAVYVRADADPAMAERIVVNAKAQRPSACNAAEQLLVDAAAPAELLPRLARALVSAGVELRAEPAAAAALAAAGVPHRAAAAADWTEEFLSLVMAVRLVPGLEAAIDWINAHGSAHSDAIVTADEAAARRFLAGVDSAAVYWNASTRFTDGFEFGLGAEIGISTDRLHARGPMGLEELCSYKFQVVGTGQVRS